MKENIYVRKIGDKKYEIITKDANIVAGVYKMYLEDDFILLKLLSKKEEKKEGQKKEKAENKERVEKQIINELNKKGFVVIESEMLAKSISNLLSKEIKEKRIVGIRGFDKKFYLFKVPYFIKLKKRILGLLKKGSETIEKLHKITNEPIDALKGAAEIIKEEGLIFEERGGKLKIIGNDHESN